MPFGKFKDWQDCMNKMQSKYPDLETRKKVCGKLQTELGG